MCLAVIGKIIEADCAQSWATVEMWGVIQQVGTQLVDPVKVGDYILIHAGYAIAKIDPTEAQERVRYWEEILDAHI